MSIEALITTVVAMSFHVSADQAKLHVEAATAAAQKYKLPVELLLGMAYIESRFDQTALSRLECPDDTAKTCKRVTTVWASDSKPAHAYPSWFCGPVQTGGNVSWEDCTRMKNDLTYGYETGAKELTIWLNDPHCASLPDDARLRCGLAGYGAGYNGVEIYTTMKYPTNVLWATGRIKQLAEIADKQISEPRS